MTIHKVQGASLSKVIVSLGSKESRGLTDTALSRVAQHLKACCCKCPKILQDWSIRLREASIPLQRFVTWFLESRKSLQRMNDLYPVKTVGNGL